VRVHSNARTTPRSRARLVQRVLQDEWPAARVACAFHVSQRTVWKWVGRYRREGLDGLRDRSAAPRRCPHRTRPRCVLDIVALRAQRLPGHVIARRVGLPRSTVGRVLRRVGLGRLAPLRPPPPVHRYERATPGELFHIDIKSLGRIRGVGHRIHGDRRTACAGSVGSMSTSASTTRADSPTSRSSRLRSDPTRSAFSSARSRGLRAKAYARNA